MVWKKERKIFLEAYCTENNTHINTLKVSSEPMYRKQFKSSIAAVHVIINLYIAMATQTFYCSSLCY